MNFYLPRSVEGHEWVNFVDPDQYEIIFSLSGVPRAGTWTSPVIRLVSPTAGADARRSDFPWLGTFALILRPQAVLAVSDLLGRAELLPLVTEDSREEMSLLNVPVVDALDLSRSQVKRLPSGDIMYLRSVSFLQDRLAETHCFRLPHRASCTYVSEAFARRVMGSDLLGLEFRPVDGQAVLHR